MKKLACVLAVVATATSMTAFASESASFGVVNVALSIVKNNLPKGCKLESKDPVIVSRSPVKVVYTYVLTKGNKSSEISFEQSQNDFVIDGDNSTWESLSNADGSFYLKMDGNQQVQVLKVNDLVCKK